MKGDYITLKAKDGGEFKGYLSLPEGGTGPGMVALQEIFGINANMRRVADELAAEGYVAIVPDLYWRVEPGVEIPYGPENFPRAREMVSRMDLDLAIQDILTTVEALRIRPEVDGWSEAKGRNKVAVVGYCLGGRLAFLTAARAKKNQIAAAISYYGVKLEENLMEASKVTCPIIFHFGGKDELTPPSLISKVREAFGKSSNAEIYVYSEAGHAFATPLRPDVYNKFSSHLADQRSLSLLRRELGPRVDLSELWEKHSEAEFIARNAIQTMETMVAEPYVNLIPITSGSYGYDQVKEFYERVLIAGTPADFNLTPVSQTVGSNQLVDEFVISFTHDIQMDWILPGVPPTGKFVKVPVVAIVGFKGKKLDYEHIYWDQASVLVQIGLLDGSNLPVKGVKTADKLLEMKLPN